MKKIKVNKIRCKKCNQIIESTHRHNFKFCQCGAVAVDGGKDYLRRCGNREDWEELSEFEEEGMGDTKMTDFDVAGVIEIEEQRCGTSGVLDFEIAEVFGIEEERRGIAECEYQAWEIMQSNPEQKELFSMERTCQQIEKELDAEKIYTIMTERNSNEVAVVETFVLISNAMGLAVATGNAALIKHLLEAGMHIELETIIVIECYEDDMIEKHHEITLMEVLANFNEMEEQDYAFCWKKARETSSWPLQKPLELRLPVSEKLNSDVLVHKVRHLEPYWEEAANELLVAFVKYYFMRIEALPEGTWEDLCSKLGDKIQLLYETVFCEMLKSGLESGTSNYNRSRKKIVHLLGDFFQKNMDEAEFKNYVFSMMDTLLEDYD